MKKQTKADVRTKIVFEHDSDADFSWLEQDHYNPSHPSYEPTYPSKEVMDAGGKPHDPEYYRNPENHVALSMLVYRMTDEDEDWQLVDSLHGIDFLFACDDWTTGTFYSVDSIPERFSYQKELVAETISA